jgi:hypothetical protein
MKKIILIACLVVTGTVSAQRNKPTVDKPDEVTVGVTDHENKKKHIDKSGDKPLQNVNAPTTTSGNSGGVGNGKKADDDFQKSLEGVVRSDFGKSKAPEVKTPKNDEEAEAQISELKGNSKDGLNNAEEKIAIARTRLEALKASGGISDDDYNTKSSELDAIEKRKDSLKSSL